MPKRILVIGAGASGMTSVKACLEQGLTPVVFEKTTYTGGLWRFQEKLDENGIASVMKSTIINSSKEMSSFSDYPPPVECPNYMHNTKMVGYFDDYSNQFNFLDYVHFQREIKDVRMADDFDQTGRWVVRYKDLANNTENEETFDGVMICTGHHGTVSMPTFPGQEKFKGKVMHTHSLKSAKGFDNQNVVVVGIGNSGGDAAVELSTVTKQVYLSTRRGTWVNKRVGDNGLPFDQYFHRRFLTFLMGLLPYWVTCAFHERKLNKIFNHDDYQLKPKHRSLQQHIMVNDALPNRILSGTVQVKGDIDHFEENGVVFKGETKVTPCDTVVMATGYKVHFPFISNDILPVERNRVRLYKYEYIPHLKHPETLAFIGLIQPIGAIIPIAELQARWFSLLNAGKLRLPSRDVMERDIDSKAAEQKRYYESERHTIQVNWVPFMDELAKEVGVYPPILRYLFTDFKLFWSLIFDPVSPYQFRLVGPNSWSGARDAQLQVMNRIKGALKTKYPGDSSNSCKKCQSICLVKLSLVIAILGIGAYMFLNYSG